MVLITTETWTLPMDTPEQHQLDDAIDKLAALGTVRDIALHLEGLGVQAECGNTHHCAVAEYLTSTVELADEHAVTVGPTSAMIYNREAFDKGDYMKVAYAELPGNVREFIARFDAYEYPELMSPVAKTLAAQRGQW